MLGISRSTLYKMLPELVPPGLAEQRLDAQIAALPADTRPEPSTVAYDALLRGASASTAGAADLSPDLSPAGSQGLHDRGSAG